MPMQRAAHGMHALEPDRKLTGFHSAREPSRQLRSIADVDASRVGWSLALNKARFPTMIRLPPQYAALDGISQPSCHAGVLNVVSSAS